MSAGNHFLLHTYVSLNVHVHILFLLLPSASPSGNCSICPVHEKRRISGWQCVHSELVSVRVFLVIAAM